MYIYICIYNDIYIYIHIFTDIHIIHHTYTSYIIHMHRYIGFFHYCIELYMYNMMWNCQGPWHSMPNWPVDISRRPWNRTYHSINRTWYSYVFTDGCWANMVTQSGLGGLPCWPWRYYSQSDERRFLPWSIYIHYMSIYKLHAVMSILEILFVFGHWTLGD